jgi:predicted nucleotidyltransferase
MQTEALADTRLVGGTALALHIGHRKSIDIDLFGTINTDWDNLLDDFFLDYFNTVKKIKQTKNILVLSVNGIKVDLVNYNYHWLEDLIVEDGIRLAAIPDIAAMKLAAITGRGTKKDFVDLYFLLKEYRLKELIKLYKQKFTDASEYLLLKSLIYFEDAEKDPMPEMIVDVEWQEIKKSVREEVKALS